MFRVLLAFVLLSLCQSSLGASQWFDNVEITNVYYYWDGGQQVVGVEWNNSLATGCSKSDQDKVAGYWSASVNDYHKIRFSSLLAAHLSGKETSLLLEATNCSSTYGARLQGIKVH